MDKLDRSTLYPIDIVLVSWYRPEITEKVIKAFKRNTYRDHYRLIVIDNGSPQEQQNMLRALQDNAYIDSLILNEENLGLEAARNQGLDSVDSPLFICADSDCLPQPIKGGKDWIERLVELLEKYPEYAAISCRTQVMIGSGNPFDGHEEEDILDFPHPGGSLRIMYTDLVKKVGGWRNEVKGRGTEERYICGKLRELGYKTGFAIQIRTLHLFGDRPTSDRWGYPKDWEPQQTGHSDIYHPALELGDDLEEVKRYTG